MTRRLATRWTPANRSGRRSDAHIPAPATPRAEIAALLVGLPLAESFLPQRPTRLLGEVARHLEPRIVILSAVLCPRKSVCFIGQLYEADREGARVHRQPPLRGGSGVGRVPGLRARSYEGLASLLQT